MLRLGIKRKMMQKGSSVPWWQVLHELTDGRTDRIDPSAILDYFRPLHEWLLQQNLRVEDDWKCDDFLDRENFTVKSYDSKYLQLTAPKNLSSRPRAAVALFSFSFIFKLFNYFFFNFAFIYLFISF
jgi:hypothetical protein